jgi:hypothetical protein
LALGTLSAPRGMERCRVPKSEQSAVFICVACACVISFAALSQAARSTISYTLGGRHATRDALERAVRIDPNNYTSITTLGSYWYARNDCGRALPYFNAALALYPTAVLPQLYRKRCVLRLSGHNSPLVGN